MYTPEELLERKRASDKRRYDLNPAKKIEANRQWRQQLKLKILEYFSFVSAFTIT